MMLRGQQSRPGSEPPPAQRTERANVLDAHGKRDGTLRGAGQLAPTVSKKPIKWLGQAAGTSKPAERKSQLRNSSVSLRSHIDVGDVLIDKYEVLGLLGSGGDAYVLRAFHRVFDCEVALKFLRSELIDDAEARQRFAHEAKLHAKLRSEHIARIFDVESLPDGRPFLVLERLHGYDLRVALNDHVRLSIARSVALAVQACEALAVAHVAGLVHGNLTPENLFLTHPHGAEQIKLLNFGANRDAFASQQHVPTVDVPGSPPYMAPEQMRGEAAIDQRADLWSLGCILYEMLTGRAPFQRKTMHATCAAVLEARTAPPRALRPELSAELEAVVMRCLAKEPSQRFPDAAALAEALSELGPESVVSHAVRARRLLEEHELAHRTLLPVELVTPRKSSASYAVPISEARNGGRALLPRLSAALALGALAVLMLQPGPRPPRARPANTTASSQPELVSGPDRCEVGETMHDLEAVTLMTEAVELAGATRWSVLAASYGLSVEPETALLRRSERLAKRAARADQRRMTRAVRGRVSAQASVQAGDLPPLPAVSPKLDSASAAR